MKKNQRFRNLLCAVLTLAMLLSVAVSASASFEPIQTQNVNIDSTVTIEAPTMDGAPVEAQDIEMSAEEAPAMEASVPMATGTVDERLVGEWHCYDSAYNVDFRNDVLDFVGDLEIILPNGVFTEYFSFREGVVLGVAPIVASAENGSFDVGEALIEYAKCIAKVSGNEELAAEAEKLSNIEVSYELFDISSENIEDKYVSDAIKPFYDLADNDGLRIHVTGKYKADPLTTKTYDATFTFRRELCSFVFGEALLCGDWTDSDGNVWSFGYAGDESDDPDFVFTMTASDGTVYTGDDFYISQRADGTIRASFDFDEFSSPDYSSIKLTADTVTFESDEGTLVLTRK